MADPNNPGPFSEFAQPKPSAVEAHKEAMETDRETRNQRRLLLAMLLVGGALGASLGEAYATSPETQPLAFVMALAGGLVGALIGWGVAAASWAQLAFQSKMYLPGMRPLGAEMVRGNQWDRLTVWLAIWGSIGIAVGAALGAGLSLQYFNRFAEVDQPAWQWLGACAGLLLVGALWTVIRSGRVLVAIMAILVIGSLVGCWLLGRNG